MRQFSHVCVINQVFTIGQKFQMNPNSKGLADNIINIDNVTKLVVDRVENIVGKGETAGDKHFFLFP